ncbi:hypothetical protein [Spiroplasma endosymbiont of Tipula paludosa]|uniref:hypothetical protein n=1 Tax=Spiroplasma endosymbiont of Tipula paludosa TaxID=3066295 RepID=UPI0035C93676
MLDKYKDKNEFYSLVGIKCYSYVPSLMINWILTASQIITILRPLAIIAKATVNFSTTIFPVFKTVPAFYYTFQFLIGFAIFLMILRVFL